MVTDPHQARTLATAVQTLDHHAHAATAADGLTNTFIPYLNGHQELQDPPGSVWLLVSCFHLLASEGTSTEDLIRIGRYTGFAMTLVAICAVFWIGVSIEGLYAGLCAASICATSWAFVATGRSVTADSFFQGWSTLCIAAALWATRPLRPMPSVTRQAIGWTVCGLTLGAAVLTVGPVGLVGTVLPIAFILMICPYRLGHLLGLLAAALIAALTVFPWVVYVHGQDPTLLTLWRESLTPWMVRDGADRDLGREMLMLIAVTLPWTLWLLAAAATPFIPSTKGVRLRLILGWIWLLSGGAGVVLWTRVEDVGTATTLVVPLSIVLAQLFHRLAVLTDEGRFPLWAKVTSWAYQATLAVASVAGVVVVSRRVPLPGFIDTGWTFEPPPAWWLAWGWGLMMILPVGLGARWLKKQDFKKAACTWVLWAWMAVTGFLILRSCAPRADDPFEAFVASVVTIAGDRPIYWLRPDPMPPGYAPPPARLLLHLRRPLPSVASSLTHQVFEDQDEIYVIGHAAGGRPLHGTEAATKREGVDLMLWRCEK